MSDKDVMINALQYRIYEIESGLYYTDQDHKTVLLLKERINLINNNIKCHWTLTV